MAKKEYSSPNIGNVNFIDPTDSDGFGRRLINQLYNSDANWNRVAAKGLKGVGKEGVEEALKRMFAEQQAFGASPFSTKADLGNGVTGNALKNTLGFNSSSSDGNFTKLFSCSFIKSIICIGCVLIFSIYSAPVLFISAL